MREERFAMALTLKGCFTALVTPFDAGGRVDFGRLKEQVKFQVEAKIAGVVPCGTTGESPTLTEEEQHKVISTCVEFAKARGLAVIAGTGSNSTAHAMEAQKEAAKLGADAGLSVNPYYNKPTQEGLYRHFMAVAEAANLPVVLYNIPGRTGVALTPETVARLAKHANIVAVKEATGSLDSASEIALRCGEDITILSGDDSMTLPFASVGATGVVSVVSNILPGRVQALCDAFNGGDWAGARRIHFELFDLCKGLLTAATNPIPIKTAMKILGRDAGVFRLPMCGGDEAFERSIRSMLIEKTRLLSASHGSPTLIA